jgi:LPS sulfotransferase NodH
MPPARSYIIASTPRTGSSLLCEGLAATGVAGRPAEPFAPDFRRRWHDYFLLGRRAGFPQFLEAAVRFGTSPDGVYGLKIQWMHVGGLARDAGFTGPSEDVLEWLFPHPTYVVMVRRDRLAQALSWHRALVTNEWWRLDGAPVPRTPPAPVPDAVLRLQMEIEDQESAWMRYFSRRGADALVVEYETLAEDYRRQVGRVLAHLGLDALRAGALPPPRLVRQSDAMTLRWRRSIEDAMGEG